MAWWKAVEHFRIKFWLPWMVSVALLLFVGYQYLIPDQCDRGGCVDRRGEYVQTPSIPVCKDASRIAVCLVGGARTFELTGRTLRRHVLDVYNNTDVFLHAPLDKDTHKLTLLAGRNLRAAKIFIPTALPENNTTRQLITSWGSPHGLQGLLQYFNLVEGCWGMVKKYEVHHKFKYDWVIRTRLDGYWNAPLPNLTALDPSYYYVAAGSDFHGLNDRFGLGSDRTSRAANARLSLLPLLHQRGYRGLNSESAYKAQLVVSGVLYQRLQLPFCIMTLRKEAYPPPPYGLLVASMDTRGPLSGTYCRPCHKKASRVVSKAIVDKTMRDWDWPGQVDDFIACDARQPWAPNWREIAHEAYKRDMPGEELQDFSVRSLRQCIKEMREFQHQWEVWDAPPADTICKRSLSAT